MSFKGVVILVAFASLATSQHIFPKRFGSKIVGGTEVEIEDYPYQLSLESRGSHICGASIIDKNTALTAAHCTEGREAYTLGVRTASSFRGKGGQVIKVLEIEQHPLYNFPDYDLSILHLTEELPIGTPGCSAIELADSGAVPEAGTKVNVTGWGYTSEGGFPSNKLMKIEVQIIDHTECQEVYGEEVVTDRLICAGVPEGGKDACQGDSGGPLVSNNILLGAVTGGDGCARPHTPTVYASVPSMRDWIKEVTGV